MAKINVNSRKNTINGDYSDNGLFIKFACVMENESSKIVSFDGGVFKTEGSTLKELGNISITEAYTISAKSFSDISTIADLGAKVIQAIKDEV